MPKQIYSNFLGGLSYYDRNAPANQYYEGREIDPHRGRGYLQPGWLLSEITKSTDSPQIIDGTITDMCFDEDGSYLYFIDDNHLYKMIVSTEAFDDDFDGAGNYYYAIPSASQGYKLIVYNISGTQYLFFAYKTATKGDVGTYDFGSTFNPDFFSTDVGAGANDLEAAPMDMLVWKSYLFVSHGQYVARYDGANDTLAYHKLNLGKGWEITKLFPTENYIGVCASRQITRTGHTEKTDSRVFFWDGSSIDWTYWKPISDWEITTAINNEGTILLFTEGKDFAGVVRELKEFGTKKRRKLKVPINGTMTEFGAPNQNAVDVFGNRIVFGSEYLVFSYGQEEDGQPMAITIPWGVAKATTINTISAIKTVSDNKVYIAYTGNSGSTIYYLLKANIGNSTRATYRGCYTDAGQKIRINYVKFYFKPLVSGDSVTVSLDTDYGTSNSLGTISYTADGAITSKKFIKNIICHAFRPVISWMAGGAAFSKIVVDFDYIND